MHIFKDLFFLISAGDLSHLSSPWHRHAEQLNATNHVSSLISDSRSVPWNSRNSSLTHTSNCSNSNDQNALASTNNSESFLIASSDNNSSSKPIPLPPPKNISSSPAATHRFPYLHCIPCLNEKPEPSKHLADNKVTEGNVVIGNGTVATNVSTSDAASNRTSELQKSQSPSSLERTSVSTGHQCSIQNSDTHEISSNRQSNISGSLKLFIIFVF